MGKKVFVNKTPGVLSIQQLRITVARDQQFEITEEQLKQFEDLFKTLVERGWVVEVTPQEDKQEQNKQETEKQDSELDEQRPNEGLQSEPAIEATATEPAPQTSAEQMAVAEPMPSTPNVPTNSDSNQKQSKGKRRSK